MTDLTVEGHRIIRDAAEAARALEHDAVIGLDTETTGLNPWTDQLALVQLYGNESGALAVVRVPNGMLPDPLRQLMNRSQATWVAHNAVAFDGIFLANEGVHTDGMRWHDTLVGETVITTAGRRDVRVNLRASVKRRLGVSIDKDLDHTAWGRAELTDEQLIYAASDVLHLPALMRTQLEEAERTGQTRALEMEQRLMPWVCRMTLNGLPISGARLEDYRTAQRHEYDAAQTRLAHTFPLVANWGSHVQIKRALNEAGISVPNTQKETLIEFALVLGEPASTILWDIIRVRSAQKRFGMYDDEWVGKYVVNGRVHARFWQCGADTTRFTSSDPNLQQIPRDMRLVFTDEVYGGLMVSVDYSQIEIRIAANIAQDAVLLAMLAAEDLHTAIAAEVFQKRTDQVTPEERKYAKAQTFTLLFGGGPQALFSYARSGGSMMTYDQAAEMVRTFFRRFEGLKSVRQRARELAKRDSVVITLPNGARRILVAEKKRPTTILNTTVQGTAAVGIKYAMLRCADAGLFRYIGAQVHDELVACVPESEVEDFSHELQSCMVAGMQDAQPGLLVRVDAKVGKEWQR